jgi:hypothetical protein
MGWLAAALIALVTGCSTLQYRTIQERFETAVRSDNERSTMPFTDLTSHYQAVADELTPGTIRRLEVKLQPNAWTLRAVSQWRAGEFSEAVTSSLEGLNEIARQSPQTPALQHGRDSIVLTMLPGLIEDSRLRQRLREHGVADVTEHYEEYASRFRTAVRALAEARGKAAAPTPPEVIAYWNYQCWRILQNWSFVLAQLPLELAAQPNQEADAFVATTLADARLGEPATLPAAMAAAEQALPAVHPYRALIELERHL